MTPKALLVTSLLVSTVSAYIYSYKDEPLRLGHLEYRRVGMFSKDDSPTISPPGDGHTFINVDVSIRRTTYTRGGVLELVTLHSDTMPFIGYADINQEKHFCCTRDVLAAHVDGCTEDRLGHIIVRSGSNPPIQVHTVYWDKDEETVPVKHNFDLEKTGRYYLLFSSCLNSTGDAYMTGSIVWMNPYGYLPGELYPFIPLFGRLALAYLVLLVLWGGLCFAYRSQLLQLQHYVTIVILLGLFETMTWYFDYQNFNTSGTRPVGPVIVGVLLSSFKRTLSRLLVLTVCMGYGVMKPSLSTEQRRKVITLGVVYFGFSSIYDVMSSYSQMTFAMQRARTFFLVPVAALDSIFFLLVLQEISTNMQLLRAHQQAAKLAVYTRFWYILVLTGAFSVLWVLYQIYTAVKVDEDNRWQALWAFEGAWHITYFVVLVAVAFLWRPNSHTLLYAFSDQLAADDDKEMQSSIRPSSEALEPAFHADGSDDEK